MSTVVQVDSIYLSRMRREALRKGVWFKILNVTERAILILAPRCMEKARSDKLIDILANIIVKIKDAIKSRLTVFTSQFGWPMALKMSQLAVKWGHGTARMWGHDAGFRRYLAVVWMNDNPCLPKKAVGEVVGS